MHDRSPNGSPSWPPHWPLDILLSIKEDLGGVKEGVSRSLANDREIFQAMHGFRERMTTLEERTRTPHSTPPPTGAAALLTSLTGMCKALADVLPRLREMVAALLLLAAAMGLIAQPVQRSPDPAPSVERATEP